MESRKIRTRTKIVDIFFDEKLYPRSGFNWQTSYDYLQSMKTGAIFPPITLAIYKGKKYLVDGKHRLESTKQLKEDEIDSIVYTGWDLKKIFEESIRRNITHGRVLSPFEKRELALKLKKLDYSPLKISDLLQIPVSKLDSFIMTRLVNAITGEVEDESVIKSGVKHLAGKTMTVEELKNLQKQQSFWNMTNQVDLINQIISLLENNFIDRNSKKIKELLAKLKTLL